MQTSLEEKREGYKLTALGWIPEDWELCNLKDILRKGKNVTYGIVQPGNYDHDGVIMIRSQDYSNGWMAESKMMKVSRVLDESYKRSRVNKGDILITVVGANIGKLAIVPQNLNNANISRSVARICIDNKCYESSFIYQFLSSGAIDKLISLSQLGGAQPVLNLKELGVLKIPKLELVEQRAIATMLSTWDKGIEKLQQLITAKQKRKKALMQQLLTGKKRFKEFTGEWQEVTLGDIFKRITRKNTEANTNVLTISAQKGLINQEHYFKKQVASETLDNYFLLRKGEFAYNKSYSNGYPMGAIKRLKYYDAGVVTTLYICFSMKDNTKHSPEFMEQYFNAGFLNRGLKTIAHEGGRAHGLLNVTPVDFFNLKMQIPDFKEQVKIALVLNIAEKEIDTLQQKLNALKQQKKGLMQKLLTGQARVQNFAT